MKFYSYTKLTRINKPAGIWLLFLPCLFGIAFALKNVSQIDFFNLLHFLFLFAMGSILMRSAGCVINDLFDVKFDKLVKRTKERAIANDEISKKEALVFLSFLLLASLIILLQFNLKTILSGFLILILVIFYPLMKRISYYPQFFLGITFNFGVIMANFAFVNYVNLEVVILYIATVIWTIIYDTIYGFQDIEDDLKIGVKSFSIKIQNNPCKFLNYLTLAMFLTLVFFGFLAKLRAEFFIIIFIADIYLNNIIKKCDFNNSLSCLSAFKSNIKVGFLILLAIILG